MIHVLVIDDNPIFLRTVINFLHRFPDFELLGTAANGEEGLDKAQQLLPEIALIDLNMPGISGLQVVSKLRAEVPSVGLIVLTLMEDTYYREASAKGGADAFVSKYHMMEDLPTAIRDVAEMRASAPPL